jgi:NAD kinase
MRLGVVANPTHDALGDVAAELRRFADALGFQLVVGPELVEHFSSEEALESAADRVDVLLTLGGDGTLLRGAQIAGPLGVPVLGCNLGQLGFLTAGARSDLEAMLRRLAAQEFHEEERTALDIELLTGGAAGTDGAGVVSSYYALNDAVVHQTGLARLIRLQVSVVQRRWYRDFERYRIYGVQSQRRGSDPGSDARRARRHADLSSFSGHPAGGCAFHVDNPGGDRFRGGGPRERGRAGR